MVFQDGALFPHLTVAENVAFGAARAASACASASRSSGSPTAPAPTRTSCRAASASGSRWRARSRREPAVVLLDEPFAALDAGLRERCAQEVAAILAPPGATALLVTHDQAEALSLADRVAVMRDGRIEQVGTPEEIYERPATRWVAAFVGETEACPAPADGGVVECELGRFRAQHGAAGAVEVVIRPEAVAIGLTAAGREDARRAVVEARALLRPRPARQLRLASGRGIRSRRLGFPAWHPGDHVRVWIEGPVTTVAPVAVSA